MFGILKDIIGTNKAMPVAKYSILQMIDGGIPECIIRRLTGYSDDVYGQYQEEIAEIAKDSNFNEIV